ncbi:hypothetical protein [Aquibacillus sediminis]|uniref:hypothetical protein n=1 Tax=Aquibacillus sediminis TaxID=2574734 RepID=UPI001109E20E|nr:hypothetical protein [Aquibacillus sediminis]
MLIEKQDFVAFKAFCRGYFKKQREAKSIEVLQELKVAERKLYRKMEKAVGKRKIKGYVGRLLRSVSREGWLYYKQKDWKTKPEWGYCTYCFSPLEDIYVIDIDDHQYCNSDCFDELEAEPHYDGYADDYLFLFWDFEKLKDKYTSYLNRSLQKDFATHLELSVILRDINNVMNDSDYATVLWNGGDDGPVAGEMYRMLMTLREDSELLGKQLVQCKKALPDTTKRFAIEVSDAIMRKRKRPEVLREFIRNHRKYRDKENNHKWFTTDSFQRMQWYDALTQDEALTKEISWLNEVDCPECNQIVDDKSSRRAPDDFYYCEACYRELDLYYKFEEDVL